MEKTELLATVIDSQWRYDLPLQGELVTIKISDGTVTPGSKEEVDGAAHNDKIGRVECGTDAVCRVITIDGMCLTVPRVNLVELVPDRPEDGGFDVCSPTDDISAHEVSYNMAVCLSAKGYCVMQMGEQKNRVESLHQEARWYKSFVSPPPEFEVEYLGHEPKSKLAWIEGDSHDLQAADGSAVNYYTGSVSAISSLLISNAGDALHLHGAAEVGKFMLRSHFASQSEISSLSPGPLTEEQKQDGEVGKFLDFVHRRRLCCMYFVTCEGGTIELTVRDADSSMKNVTLPALEGKLLFFRQDLLDHAFRPSGDHLIVQGWVLSEPRSICLREVMGTEDEIMQMTGARTHVYNQPMSRGDDVHIMAVSCMIGSEGHGLGGVGMVYSYQADNLVKVPKARWDHDIYYTPDGGTMALCQHAGFVEHENMFAFDPDFYGISYEQARALVGHTKMELDSVMEVLIDVGHTKESARGAKIDLYAAGNARDADTGLRCSTSRDEARWGDHFISVQLIVHLLGLKGKCIFIDTACSASNVATQLAYQNMRIRRDAREYHGCSGDVAEGVEAMMCSSMFIDAPWAFIGLSQAHMLGVTGRSKTYDNSANGYARSEGCGCLYLQNDNSVEVGTRRLADIIGGMVNQDGKSASLTAPSGPSQALIVQGAQRDCGRHPRDVCLTEMHGTGTALGDPVETGSVKNALNKDRYSPLVYQAGKSQTGHLEMGAGVTGIIKTICATIKGCFYSNCHLRELNSNIDEANFPALWPTEIGDLGLEWIHCGVSSFGFGGTNCRTCLWTSVQSCNRKVAAVTKHPEMRGMVVARLSEADIKKIDFDKMPAMLATCARCSGSMCWMCGETDESMSAGKHYCSQIREDPTSYDICSSCYKGEFRSGQRSMLSVGSSGRTVYIVGSWSNWEEYEEMRQAEDGSYVHAVRLGSSRTEQFILVLDADSNETLYPVVDDATPSTRIAGPDGNAKGRSWLIDGRDRNVPDDTLYRIQFDWDYNKKSIGWEAALTPDKKADLSKDVGHKVFSEIAGQTDAFSIVGSFSKWAPRRMDQNKSDEKLWETSFEIGLHGMEEFQFVCNDSFAKAIYPAAIRAVDTSVHIKGPNDKGTGWNWLICGMMTEVVTVQLRVSDGDITMTTSCKSSGSRTWKSKATYKPRYYLIGTWTDWKWSDSDGFELKADKWHPNVYKCRMSLRRHIEEFQIGIDKDVSRMYHPPRLASTRQSLVQGPDDQGYHFNWSVKGRVGQQVEIVLDLSSDTKGPDVCYNML